jgi:hypothetical protein
MSVPRALSTGAVSPEAFAPGGLLDALEGLVAELDDVRLDITGLEPLDRLKAAEEELFVVREELTAQLRAVVSPAGGGGDERLLMRRLATALPVPLLSTDVNGVVLECNPAAAELLGTSWRELPGKPVFAYVGAASRLEGRNLLRAASDGGQIVEGTLTLTCNLRCHVAVAPVPAAPPAVTAAADPGDDPARGDPVRPDVVRWVLQASGVDDDVVNRISLSTVVELCELGAGDADTRSLLHRVAQLACDGMAWVDAASVQLGDSAEPNLTVWSSALAQAADGAQHNTGCGPSFETLSRAEPVGTDDMFGDARWPALARWSGRRPVHACLAVPIVVDGRTTGVLTLYGHGAGLRTPESRLQSAPFVAAVQTLVRDGRLIEELVAVRGQLQEALTSRAIIDQAKGMVMLTERCGPEEAFALLARMSQSDGRKVRDIAADIVAHRGGAGSSRAPVRPARSAPPRKPGRRRRA